MELLFSIGLHNAVVMAILALLVWIATRFSKSAPVAHLLWVLVLAKLLTPPVVNFDASRWTDFNRNSAKTTERPEPIVRQPEVADAHDSSPRPERSVPVAVEPPQLRAEVIEPAVAPAAALPQPVAPSASRPSLPSFETIRTVLAWTWLIGAVLLAGLAWLRIASFQRMLAQLPPAPGRLQLLADDLAQRMGLKRSATVLQVESALPPFVWCFGSQRVVVLPRTLLDTLAEQQLALVLAHELAHLRRRDHWVRVVELTVSILYWWNPLVWGVRRQLHAAEEQCCDAWVLWLYPDQNQLYAESLLKSADIVSGRSLALSSPFLNSHTLRGRIESVLINRSPRRATRLAVACLAILAAAALPSGISVVRGQVQDEPKVAQPAPDVRKSDAPQPEAVQPATEVAANPTLHDLMQQMAVFERAYLPYDMQVMETFRFPDDLTPQERAKNLLADGRKHQRLMEYAQLAPRIWRRKETDLVDDEINQGPYEQFSDGERIVQRGPASVVINGNQTIEYSIRHKKNAIQNYQLCTPLTGVFCLSTFSNAELFSQAFPDEDAVQLAWDKGDAKLSFGYGKPHWNMRFVLWLSRAHAWHPIRMQRFWNADDELFHDEWEVTKFAQRGKLWRVIEGTLRYRDMVEKGQPQDPKIKYSIDFKVLEEKFGSDVDPKQFEIEIPEGAAVRDDRKPDAEPPPPEKTRAIKVTVVDVANQPIPGATVRLPASPLHNFDVLTTDAQGLAQSAKAPADNVTVQITAAGFRPVTWIMGNVDELRAIMAPVSSGTVTAVGKPVADAWVTNETLQIRADGYAYVPSRDWDGRNQDWSDSAGKFELKTPLTLRRDAVVPLIAINPDRDRMAIRFVTADQLAQPQSLVLQPVCHVRGQCLLEGAGETVEVGIGLASSTGPSVGFLSTRRSRVAGGLRVDFQLRLPPGDYVLKSRGTSHHAEFSIPVAIPAGQTELDLGTTKVPAPKTALLRGKPAPALDVLWRPGQETTWEKLRGKVVVLDFWGTWCGPCVSGKPVLMDIAQQFREKPVEWISIHTPNLETFEKLDPAIAQCQEKSWNKRALPFTTVIDRPVAGSEDAGKTEQNYGVVEWPTLIVVDQQGLVVGAIPKNKLAETIDRLVATKDPETSSNKPSPTTPAPKVGDEPPVPKNLRPFQGTWDVERYGSLKWPADLDEARTWQWTIQGNEITWTRPGHAPLKLSFAVDAGFTGAAKTYDNKIELTLLDGPDQGQKCPGIFYWMQGQDTLWVCFRDPGTGGERPKIMGFNGYDRHTLLALRPGKLRPTTDAPAELVPPREENPHLKDGLQVFQGTWKFDGCESVLWYTPLADIRASWQWAIEGHEIVWTRAGKKPVRMRFSIDASRQPNQIDLTFLDGPDKGKSCQGMYRFERTTLWICMTEPGANVPRPEKLAMSSDSHTALILLHQVPKQRVVLPDQPAQAPKAPAPPAMAPPGLSLLQGSFHVESWTSEHWPAREHEFQQWHWTIQGREVTWTRPGHDPVRLSLSADPSQPLPELDLTFLDGPDQGRTCRGVYMDSRHEVEICFADPGAEVDRPKSLGAKPGSHHTALTLVPDRIPPAAEEIAALRGEWKFDIYYSDWWPARISNPPFSKAAWRWTVKENEIAWTGMQIDDVHLSFQLDPTKSPRQIELTFLNGPWKGQTLPGIYRFGFGGRCDICFADPRTKAPRPTHFGYSTDSGQTWLSLERINTR